MLKILLCKSSNIYFSHSPRKRRVPVVTQSIPAPAAAFACGYFDYKLMEFVLMRGVCSRVTLVAILALNG